MDFEDNSPSSSCSCSCSSSSGNPRPAPCPSPKRKGGRKKFRETRHPLYHGVRACNGGKWVSEVREPRKKSRIWLGTYRTPETAAVAHDVAAIALRGDAAHLNFPDLARALPRAMSTAPEDVRRAAAEGAVTFGRSHSSMSSSRPPPPPSCRAVDEMRDRGRWLRLLRRRPRRRCSWTRRRFSTCRVAGGHGEGVAGDAAGVAERRRLG